MPDDGIEELAQRLRHAETSRTGCAPLTDDHPELSIDDAYSVSQRNLRHRRARGAEVSGFKAGLTAAPIREIFGAAEPNVGVLLDEMALRDGGLVDHHRFLQPAAEVEVAVVLQKRLGPGPVSAEDVLESGAVAAPAIEIVDARVAGWRYQLADMIADNAAAAAWVMGRERVPLEALDRQLRGTLSVNGEVVAEGDGSAVLGDLVAAAAWLAANVSRLETPLGPGHVLLTGSLVAPVPVHPGDEVVATLDGLGSASITFR